MEHVFVGCFLSIWFVLELEKDQIMIGFPQRGQRGSSVYVLEISIQEDYCAVLPGGAIHKLIESREGRV